MPPPTPTRTRAPSRGREVVLIMVPRALGCRGGARPGRGSEGEVRRRHLGGVVAELQRGRSVRIGLLRRVVLVLVDLADGQQPLVDLAQRDRQGLLLVLQDRKSTRLNSSHVAISYAVFCLKKKIQLT